MFGLQKEAVGLEREEVIWLIEERTFGTLLNLGAYYSMVRYTKKGIDYEVLLSNDEFDYVDGEVSEDDNH